MRSCWLRMPNVVKLDKCFMETSVEYLKSLRIQKTHRSLFNRVEPDVFTGMIGFGRLRELNLSHNQIGTFDWNTLGGGSGGGGLSALRKLDLSWNAITALQLDPNGDEAFCLAALETLDLSRNKISRIEPDVMNGLPSLRELNLSNNRLDFVDKKEIVSNFRLFHNLAHLERLNLSHNRIVHVNQDSFAADTLEGLKTLRLDNNQIARIGFNTFARLKQLRLLDLGSNRIRCEFYEASERFGGMECLEELNLAYNQIDSLRPSTITFTQVGRLRLLSLRGNRFSDLCDGVFMLPQLLELDLSSNQIGEISARAFAGVPRLRELNLSKNRLSNIDTLQCELLRELRALDLRFNHIAHSKLQQFFEQLEKNHLTSDDKILSFRLANISKEITSKY